jgi:hypothetical protein
MTVLGQLEPAYASISIGSKYRFFPSRDVRRPTSDPSNGWPAAVASKLIDNWWNRWSLRTEPIEDLACTLEATASSGKIALCVDPWADELEVEHALVAGIQDHREESFQRYVAVADHGPVR